MKRLRFPTGTGNGTVTVPNGQILAITMVPGKGAAGLGFISGSWVRIATNAPIWVPEISVLDLQAADLGLCCGDVECDRWPGEVQIEIIFGQNAKPQPSSYAGIAPESWLVVYNGC